MITGRNLATIRTGILTLWASGMTSIGKTLDQSVGSWAYELADSLAVDVLRIEGNAEAIGTEIIPSTATTATLERQAAIQTQARQEGEVWQGTATVTGTDGTVDCTGRTLIRQGVVYALGSSSVVVSGGTGTVNILGTVAGVDTIPVGATLTWDSAPTALNPTATLASVTNTGTAAETNADLAERVESYRRARPAGGNPAHLNELAEAHTRVAVAYCYPTLAPNPGAYSDADLDTPGSVVVVVAGAAQGGGSTDTRTLSSPELAHVLAYFNGTENASEATIAGSRLYSAQLYPADFGVENAIPAGRNIDITVTNDPAHPPPWTGSMTIFSGTTTSVVVNGDQTAKNGLNAAIQTNSGGVRGRVEVRNLGVGVYDGGTGRTTFTVATLSEAAAGFVDPAPSNWLDIRNAIYAFFDSLGPGDVPDASSVAPPASVARRRRFPPESWSGPSSMSQSGLIRAAMSAVGVVDCEVTTPASTVTPGPKEWLRLNLMRIRFA